MIWFNEYNLYFLYRFGIEPRCKKIYARLMPHRYIKKHEYIKKTAAGKRKISGGVLGILKKSRLCLARSRLWENKESRAEICARCRFSDGYGHCFYTKECVYKNKA